jgi:hypothetical protein
MPSPPGRRTLSHLQPPVQVHRSGSVIPSRVQVSLVLAAACYVFLGPDAFRVRLYYSFILMKCEFDFCNCMFSTNDSFVFVKFQHFCVSVFFIFIFCFFSSAAYHSRCTRYETFYGKQNGCRFKKY